MKIYIAGPMRGHDGWNFAAFYRAERKFRRGGHQVFNPARLARAKGYGPRTHNGDERDHLRHVILTDINCILHSDAVALLPGWEHSKGATVEVAVARFLDLPLYDGETGELLGEEVPV